MSAATLCRAVLAMGTLQLDSVNPADRAVVQQALRHWRKGSDLACICKPAFILP
jgi:hypothetical protein